eukprot:6887246-Prymnesium_polylepis.1
MVRREPDSARIRERAASVPLSSPTRPSAARVASEREGEDERGRTKEERDRLQVENLVGWAITGRQGVPLGSRMPSNGDVILMHENLTSRPPRLPLPQSLALAAHAHDRQTGSVRYRTSKTLCAKKLSLDELQLLSDYATVVGVGGACTRRCRRSGP